MNGDEFKIKLDRAGLTKSRMAEILNIKIGSVNNWGSSQDIPYWVESWLDNYIKAKVSDDIIAVVKPFVKE